MNLNSSITASLGNARSLYRFVQYSAKQGIGFIFLLVVIGGTMSLLHFALSAVCALPVFVPVVFFGKSDVMARLATSPVWTLLGLAKWYFVFCPVLAGLFFSAEIDQSEHPVFTGVILTFLTYLWVALIALKSVGYFNWL